MTVLAILDMVGGIIAVLAGLGLAAGGSYFASAAGYGFLAGFIAVLGAVVLIIGLFAILVGYGLWSGKSWAWTLAVILAILGILGGLGSLATGNFGSVVGLAIDVIIVWYLWKPHVKAYFGKGTMMPTTSTPPPAPATTG
ncbi:MAG: hypothetical protein HY247_05185 [archaeon]|nr:MAG: hypothetical protein HY247_05185 [archaeon]